MRVLRSTLAGRDTGQAMILIAALLPVLIGMLLLVIEAGRVVVEFRRLQSAADVAAMVGAQALPCSTDSTATGCLAAAASAACNNAIGNGYTCSPQTRDSSNRTSQADVPPVSCSPYDFMDYGNGSGNGTPFATPACKPAQPPPFYDYLEVQLTYSLGTIPVFNIPVSLYAHAVAKHGVGVPGDYAVVQLNPAAALSMGGSNTANIIGSIFANGGITGISSDTACGGGWFSAGGISGVSTSNSSTPGYSPAGCGISSSDPIPDVGQYLPPVSDPYAGSVPPPTLAGNGNINSPSFPGCPECGQPGWWINLDTGTWYQGGSPSGHVELFPGVYSSLPNGGGNSQRAYFNPGVYTLTGGINTTGGGSCIYGAPACDDITGHCATDSFGFNTTAGATWYYQCSPYGYWDASSFNNTRPSSLPTTPPSWYDTASGQLTSIPLNGVVLYLPPNSGGDQPRGNSGAHGTINFLAAPNPCPGTGTTWSPYTQVQFPAGDASAQYQYPSTSLAYQHGAILSPLTGPNGSSMVYPTQDTGLLGECGTTLEAWQGEMPRPQHVQFLFYIQGPNSDSKLRGTIGQNYFGIFYAPTSDLTFLGNANSSSSSGGAPWLTGQIITATDYWSGHSTVTVWYRPCGAGSTACGSGAGTQLVQ